jgi:hypothetical protein
MQSAFNPDGSPSEDIEWWYNGSGLVSCEELSVYSGGVMTFQDTWSYHADGSLDYQLAGIFNVDGSLSQGIVWNYNSSGLVSSVELIVYSGGVKKSEDDWFYHADGSLNYQLQITFFSNVNGTYCQAIEWNYNDSGMVSSEEVCWYNGGFKLEEDQWFYHADGSLDYHLEYRYYNDVRWDAYQWVYSKSNRTDILEVHYDQGTKIWSQEWFFGTNQSCLWAIRKGYDHGNISIQIEMDYSHAGEDQVTEEQFDSNGNPTDEQHWTTHDAPPQQPSGDLGGLGPNGCDDDDEACEGNPPSVDDSGNIGESDGGLSTTYLAPPPEGRRPTDVPTVAPGSLAAIGSKGVPSNPPDPPPAPLLWTPIVIFSIGDWSHLKL